MLCDLKKTSTQCTHVTPGMKRGYLASKMNNFFVDDKPVVVMKKKVETS